jgi:holo-[acyl-carrier protein] synthase
MILGIGTDLANIDRIAATLERFGDRFVQRCFTEVEQRKADRRKDRAGTSAKRWAAKEACSKALGTGLRPPVTLRNIAVLRDPHGRPHFELAPPLAAWLDARGIRRHHVSLSDEGDLVLAFAIVESES